MFFGQTCMSGVWVGYGGVKTLENRSRKFDLLIFALGEGKQQFGQ